jgi:hypothetical protein
MFTVRQLIDELREYPNNTPIWVCLGEDEQGIEIVRELTAVGFETSPDGIHIIHVYLEAHDEAIEDARKDLS